MGRGVFPCNMVLDAFAKAGDLSGVDRIVKLMEQGNVPMSAISETIRIAAVAKHGRLDDAEALLSLALEKGMVPDVVLFTCMMDACGKSQSGSDGLRRAEKWFGMMREVGVKPNVITYN